VSLAVTRDGGGGERVDDSVDSARVDAIEQRVLESYSCGLPRRPMLGVALPDVRDDCRLGTMGICRSRLRACRRQMLAEDRGGKSGGRGLRLADRFDEGVSDLGGRRVEEGVN